MIEHLLITWQVRQQLGLLEQLGLQRLVLLEQLVPQRLVLLEQLELQRLVLQVLVQRLLVLVQVLLLFCCKRPGQQPTGMRSTEFFS